MIQWNPVYAIDESPSSRSHPTPLTMPRVLHFKSTREHSPTRRKTAKFTLIKGRGVVSICVTAPINLRGLTNPWALHLPSPLPRGAPHGRLRGPTWPPATCPCHLRATCALRGPCSALPLGLSAALHLCWSRAPRQLARHVSLTRHVSSAVLQ